MIDSEKLNKMRQLSKQMEMPSDASAELFEHIDALQAEVARLREALESLMEPTGLASGFAVYHMREKITKVLELSPPPTEADEK